MIITSIHDHKFDRIETKRVGDGCEVEYVLHFGAPAARYTDPAPVRNYYRFKARVSLSEGHRSFSPQFANRVPGRRVYRWKHDTTAEGCWAQKPHKVFYVDVEGCRNRNCKVEPFK
ncbi:MAG: hypothetical protein JW751_11220 [Polyangiaceae bacterium]|nr:hypothetical protein [Polyangiaceae bacterium]